MDAALVDRRRLPTLAFDFGDAALLRMALTHRSAGRPNSERLEFLGDAVLGFVIAEALYARFPMRSEGDLTRLRAALVREETLAGLARGLDLGEYLVLGDGERKSGGWRRDSILADALEALMAAVYLDAGLDAVRRVFLPVFESRIDALGDGRIPKDPKTELQEWLHARSRALPGYRVDGGPQSAEGGPFRAVCRVLVDGDAGDGDETESGIETTGSADTRRGAEAIAAAAMLEALAAAERAERAERVARRQRRKAALGT